MLSGVVYCITSAVLYLCQQPLHLLLYTTVAVVLSHMIMTHEKLLRFQCLVLTAIGFLVFQVY